jgi:hypothetical protein
MSAGSPPRPLPGRPSLRYLKLEAKRRLSAGEFRTLHDAQVAIAREHGQPSWTALKQLISGRAEPDSHPLDQLHWIVARFGEAGEPGWTAPGELELRQHFDDRFLSVVPPAELIAAITSIAADLREELVVMSQGTLEASEWTKIRSVRSNYWTLLVAAAATIGSTALVARMIASTPASAPGNPFTPLTASFASYAEYAVLPVSVLGVLAFSSEYATGVICTTFTAVPQRRAVLAAKAAVAGTVALIAGELLAFAAFFLTQAIVSGRHGGLSLSHPGVPGAVLAAGFLLPVCATVSLALGANRPSRPLLRLDAPLAGQLSQAVALDMLAVSQADRPEPLPG